MGNQNAQRKNTWQQKNARWFSLKPPKADLKALAAMLSKEPGFFIAELSALKPGQTCNTKFSTEHNAWQANLNLGEVAGKGVDCIIIGRGATADRAMAVAFYWLKSTPIATLFPPIEEDDDDFVF